MHLQDRLVLYAPVGDCWSDIHGQTDKTFSICFAYLQHEHEDNYTWALGMLQSVLGEGALPTAIVTDRDVALMNAISSVFPSAIHLLCRWHINRNILVKCKKLLKTKEKWDKFNVFRNMLVFSSMEDHHNLRFDLFLKEFSGYPEAVNYVINSCLNPYKDRFVAA